MKKPELIDRIDILRKSVNQAQKDVRATDATIPEKIEIIEVYINNTNQQDIRLCWHCADVLEDEGLLITLRHIQLTFDEVKSTLDMLKNINS